MLARSRNLPLLLGVLLLALGALFVSQGGLGGLSGSLVPGTAPGVASVAAPVGVPEAVRSPTYPSVNLEALASVRATPASEARNPFSLDAPVTQPPPGSPRVRPTAPTPLTPSGAPTTRPAGRPPLRLKFIGIVNLPGDLGRLAVLSDGDFVYHGRQGDIVEGR